MRGKGGREEGGGGGGKDQGDGVKRRLMERTVGARKGDTREGEGRQ